MGKRFSERFQPHSMLRHTAARGAGVVAVRYLMVAVSLVATQALAADCRRWGPLAIDFKSATTAEVRECIESGADVNARDGLGVPFLHRATEAGNVYAVRLLIESGADVNARDKIGRSPLHAAASIWDTSTADAALVLVEAGAWLEARTSIRETPLHIACQKSPATALVLLIAGADANARDHMGFTPLHWAVAPVSPDITGYQASPILVRALLAAGADVNARLDRGSTEVSALHLAASRTTKPAIIELLLTAGADASARDVNGKTPWDYAQENEALRGTDAWWRLREGARVREHRDYDWAYGDCRGRRMSAPSWRSISTNSASSYSSFCTLRSLVVLRPLREPS